MTEVHKALDELKCEWKTLASYRVRCRWVPTGAAKGGAGGRGMGGGGMGAGGGGQYIKIGLQLYKVSYATTASARHAAYSHHYETSHLHHLSLLFLPTLLCPSSPPLLPTPPPHPSSPPLLPTPPPYPSSLPLLPTPPYPFSSTPPPLPLLLYPSSTSPPPNQVQQSIYLLDFKKIEGNAFSFMTLCARIITALKTPSSASKQSWHGVG
jgi:hypothetical protein